MSQGFWVSDEGIRLRTKMLAIFIVIYTWNRALQMYGPGAGVTGFRFTTMPGACMLCLPYEGRIYRVGQFMKHIPVHPWCRCFYDAIVTPIGINDFVTSISIPMCV